MNNAVMQKQAAFCAQFGLKHPVVQGPFGGGYSTVALAAAVSNAGGLGSFGAVNLSPDEITATVAALRANTRHPFAVNLWVPIAGHEDRVVHEDAWARALSVVAPRYRARGLEPPTRPAQWAHPFEAQVEALLAAAPPVLSVVMGVPPAEVIAAAHRRNIQVIATATTAHEAEALDAAGVDAIVASGSDAGGHRGAFLRDAEDSLVGTFSLVPQVVDAVKAPVIAAGGITDGRGLVAAFALGASAAQVGTAFLASHESGAPEVHKAMLGTRAARDTALTRVFSGRLARGIVNDAMRAFSPAADSLLPYPMHNAMMAALRRDAARHNRADDLALWAGQAAPLAARRSAAEVLAALLSQAEEARKSL